MANGLKLQIATLQTSNRIDAAQAGVLSQFARAAQSAVSLLARPDDPGHAFATTFVNSLVGDVQQGLANRETAGLTGAWAGMPDQTAAETARLARQNDAPAGSFWGGPVVAPVPAADSSADWALLIPADAGSSGLRLAPGAMAEIQQAVQEGIDRAAADPSFDPQSYADRRLAELMAQAPTASGWFDPLADDAVLLAGKGGNSRPSPTIGSGPGLQIQVNQRAQTLLNVLSDGSPDQAFGLVPAAYRDIRFYAPQLAESKLAAEVERMRQFLGRGGLDVTPQKLGAVAGIDGNGRVSYNQVDLVERYANAIRLVGLSRQGLIELDPATFAVRSVGTARMAPADLIQNIEQRYQAAFARGLDEARARLADGQRLRFPADMPQQLQIGLLADASAKEAIGDYLRSVGVPEGAGQIVALNRWAYDIQGGGLYVRPDVLIDFGPNFRHWIDGKSTFVNNGVLPRQLVDFFGYTGSQTGTIATSSGNVPVSNNRGSIRRP